MKKVITLQRFLPHYRIEFYDRLSNKLKEEGVQLIALHSSKDAPEKEFLQYIKPTFVKRINLLGADMVVKMSLPFILKKFRPSLIVSEDISNLPNGLLMMLYSFFSGCRYGIAGLGKRTSNNNNIIKKMFSFFIKAYRERADFFIAYSEYGAEYYRKYNKPAYPYFNSIIDPAEPLSDDELRTKYSDIKELRLLFVGRLEPFKRLDRLIKAASLCDFKIVIDIIGDGSMMEEWEKIEHGENVVVNWHGRINRAEEKKKFYKICHAGVMPGSGGLVIQELQANSVPVIAAYSDGTEIDLIKKVNPDLFIEEITVENLKDKIGYFYRMSVDDKIFAVQKSYDITVKKYNLNNMVSIYADAVLKNLKI